MKQSTPIPAATVVPLRDGARGLEVLMLLRNAALDFAAGAWVFPGGRIDPADHRGARCEADAARNAACREAREEAGVDLSPRDLVAFSHWTTPSPRPKRFATWFFLADASATTGIRVDGGEIVAYRWLTVIEALDAAASDAMPMIRPTLATLRRLTEPVSVAEALNRVVQPLQDDARR